MPEMKQYDIIQECNNSLESISVICSLFVRSFVCLFASMFMCVCEWEAELDGGIDWDRKHHMCAGVCLFVQLLVNNHGSLLILLSNTQAHGLRVRTISTHHWTAPAMPLAGSVCIISVKNLINAVRLLSCGCC